MNAPLVHCTFLVLLLGSLSLVGQQLHSHGDPTNEEQYMLELINRARANPTAEGNRLMDTQDPRVQAAYTVFNIDKTKTRTAFAGYPVRPPLAFSSKLIDAARGHTADMVANNFQGHTGSNGSSLQQRYQAVGYAIIGQYGENVAAYSESVWYGHCGLNVDWGTQNQIDLGHRSNIMNFQGATYTEIGIGITKTNGGLQTGTVGPYVITQDFGIQNTRYILGVVFRDLNNNNEYDIGEGLTGVEVRPSSGGWYAVTSSSGGYAFPYVGTGTINVTASGGTLQAPISSTVTLSGQNVKVDFIPASAGPNTVVLRLPANNATGIKAGQITFVWDPALGAEEYELQVSTNASFPPASMVHTYRGTATTSTATLTGCGAAFHWRVRAHNAVGSSPWSTFTFTTGGKLPSPPTTIEPKGTAVADHDGSITLRWTPVDSAQRYYVIMSSNANLSSPFFVDSATTQAAIEVPVSAIPTSTFHWVVRAGNECGWSVRSSITDVNLTVTSVDESAYEVAILRPHPIAGEATLVLGEVSDAAGSAIVTNNQGQVVEVHSIGSGQSVVPGLCRGLAAGAYSITITRGVHRSVLRAIVAP
jgi:hypothetical protein